MSWDSDRTTAATPFHLEALEVRLVLDDLDETLQEKSGDVNLCE